MTADEFWEKAKELRTSGKISEAVDVSSSFVELYPKSANAWWSLTLSQKKAKNYPEAIKAVKETIKLTPKWLNGWAEYASILELNGQIDEAITAHKKALELDYNNDYCHFALDRLYEDKKDAESRIIHLEYLERNDKLVAGKINALGVLHWQKERFLLALHYFQKASNKEPEKWSLFNQALVYINKDVSQLIDAYDCLSESLEIDPSYTSSSDSLKKVVERIENEIGSNEPDPLTPLKFDDWFQFYINPFELIGLKREDNAADLLDTKGIQKAKKAVIQEIELEDGIIDSLQGFRIEKTRAIEVIDELNNGLLFQYHLTVFLNPELLYFLTRGDIRFFTFYKDHYPKDIIRHSRDSGFLKWISNIFVNQYELVIGKTIETKNDNNLKKLLSGRRIVEKNDESRCFHKVQRVLSRCLEPLEELQKASETEKPDPHIIRKIITDPIISAVLNGSRLFFSKEIEQATIWIRSMAICLNNEYRDRETSVEVLNIAMSLAAPGSSRAKKLNQDIKEINEFLKEDNKYEAKLVSGEKPWHITKKGVFNGEDNFLAEEIEGVRLGFTNIQSNGTTRVKCLFAFECGGRGIVFEWTSAHSEKQKEAFEKLSTAAFLYIYPKVTKRLHDQIRIGKTFRIGNLSLDSQGVKFEKSLLFFSTKTMLIPWSQMAAVHDHGQLKVSNKNTGLQAPDHAIAEITNAVILPNLLEAINENR